MGTARYRSTPPLRARAYAAVLPLALLCTGCDNSPTYSAPPPGAERYPHPAEVEFLNECEATAATAAECSCVLNWAERHIPAAQFVADLQDAGTTGTFGELQSAIVICRSQ
jgi:hypothetical protein